MKHILTLELDETKNTFKIMDDFRNLPLLHMSAVIGFLYEILHSYTHIHGEEQNKKSIKIN
jgi:hypothetical protein